MPKSYLLPVEKIIRETSDTVSLCFRQPKIDRIPYHAGQYLTVKVELEGKTLYRSYSLSSAPRLDEYTQITIKEVSGGKVSTYLNREVEEGQLLEFLAPAGRFWVESATKNERHLVLFAGGSGITPLFSILKSTLYHEPHSQVTLLYASRTESDIIFREDLSLLSERFPDRLRVIHALSRENHPGYWGKLTPELIQQFLEQLPELALPLSYWLCGPTQLMRMIQTELGKAGIPEENIFQERFVADERMTQRQRNFDGPTREVEVIYQGSSHRIRVPAGISVLEAGIQQGLDLPYSCKQGICSTCMGQLERGEVEMEHPEALLDFEKEMGKVLVCQCHPKTDDVRIRVS